jgi:maltose alpha-D-glucosyltransferase/alpha-amylase
MFKALAMNDITPVYHTLSKEVTPDIPPNSQWFTFLRCHDELSLELVYVTEEDRKYIHDQYCKKPQWDFRLGQGISARLSELMDRDPAKIALIYSLMLTLPGTPVIYYGDEFGKLNDEDFYHEMIRLTGKNDTRFLVRGKIDWDSLEAALKDTGSYYSRVYRALKHQITMRRAYRCFGRGDMEWLKATGRDGNPVSSIAVFVRTYLRERMLVMLNLSSAPQRVKVPQKITIDRNADVLGSKIIKDKDGFVHLSPFGYLWIELNP